RQAVNRFTVVVAVIAWLASWSPASAQSWEVSGLAGYTPSVGLENRAPELSAVDIAGGFTWGLQSAWLLTPRWGVEALWTRQSSAQTIETGDGSADLFTMTIGQLHGGVVYHLGSADARLRPFVFWGVGATFFSADAYESETKFSFGLGAGVKYFFREAIGLRAQFRYKPTMLNESAADFCDPFGFCQGMLHQIEVAAGALIRF
ncbi:MAG: acyloxyacyl hydrolase, partial [Vicinamibacterales bacterium]